MYWELALFVLALVTLLAARALKAGITELRFAAQQADEQEEKFKIAFPSRALVERLDSEFQELRSAYKKKRAEFIKQKDLVALYDLGAGTVDQSLTLEEMTPVSLDDAEAQLKKVKESLKSLVKAKKACVSEYKGTVTINNSKAAANKFFNKDVRLRLRCIDKEFALAQALVNWNNHDRLKSRCRRVFEDINESGQWTKTKISQQYFDLKVLEFDLSFAMDREKRRLKEEEREQKALERELVKDEEKLKAEKAKLEKERLLLEGLIERELKSIKGASAQQLLEIESKKTRLMELEAKAERAAALSEISKAGFVYVISNERAFGKAICKIGMTRRLDPMDRVKELGDASVPFEFEVHGIVYSSDAPKLERKLHDEYADKRVNLINRRKEFFFENPKEVLVKITEIEPSATRV